METFRVMGIDPGLTNCAAFVADITIGDGVFRIKYVDSFMLTTTLRDVDMESRKQFKKYLRKLKKMYKPDVLIIERFAPRGGFLRASIVELVNQMIVYIIEVFNIEFRQVTAASWKNVVQKKVNKVKVNDLKEIYKTHKKTLGPHRIDAALLCMLQFGFNINHTNKFIFWLARMCKKHLAQEAETVNVIQK